MLQQMRIGFGCVNVGSAASGSSWNEQVDLVHRSIDGGIDHFDTADAYASGMSERILGRALRGRRDQVTISTKGGYLFRERSVREQRARQVAARVVAAMPRGSRPDEPASAPNTSYSAQDFSPHHLRSAVDGSLRRLATDHIDVFLLHGPPTVLGEIFADLDDLRTSGKVGRFGVGAESIPSAAAWVHVPATDVVQLPFGLLDVEARTEVFDRAQSNEVDIWARGVLGGGLLSAAAHDVESVAGHPKQERIESLLRIAGESGLAVDEMAIRWLRTSADVDLVLLGMSSAAHLERNLALAALPPLPDDVLAMVESTIGQPLAQRKDDQ